MSRLKSFSCWHLSADPHEGAVVPESTALLGLTAGQFAASSTVDGAASSNPQRWGKFSMRRLEHSLYVRDMRRRLTVGIGQLATSWRGGKKG